MRKIFIVLLLTSCSVRIGSPEGKYVKPLKEIPEIHPEYVVEILNGEMCLVQDIESGRTYHVRIEDIHWAILSDNI